MSKFIEFITEEQVSGWRKYVGSDPELTAAVRILDKITKKGYKAYIVGGAVRDIIMGKASHDIDIATNMPIEEIAALWKVYDIGKSKDFGIVVVREGGYTFEVAQFRQDGKYVDGRRPEDVKITGSFEQDAERRDFTINAMGLDKDGNIIDYFDGTRDIKDKVLRTVGNPKERFGEDYLRMLRAARFSSKLGFDIEPETKQAAKELSGNVKKLAAERIKDEIWKAASGSGDRFAKFLVELDEMGILEIILPEVTKLKEFEHNLEHHPEGGPWEHTLAALKTSKVEDPLVNLAILLHDVGKGVTFDKKPDGTPTYYGHAEEGVKLVDTIATRLRMSTKEKETLLYAVANHMRFHLILGMKPSKIAKIVNDDNWDVLVAVARADEFARGHKFMTDSDFESIVNTAIEIKNKWGAKTFDKIMKVVDGKRVMELTGLKPGKDVGKIIKKVTELVIDNNITDPEMIDQLILRVHNGEITESVKYLSEGIIQTIKAAVGRAWEFLKNKIDELFSRITDDMIPGDEALITIPTQSVNEDETGMIKGNYNEVLVCKYIIDRDGKAGVRINRKKHSTVIGEIYRKTDDFDNRLKTLEKKGKDKGIRKDIEIGSAAMAAYLIGNAVKNGATITGIWCDNLAAQIDTTQKRDIRVEIKKDGEEIFDDYSLKLYSKAEVNLLNTSPMKILTVMIGPEAADEFREMLAKKSAIVDYISTSKKLDNLIDKLKKQKKEGTAPKDAEAQLEKLRSERQGYRFKINPVLADITADVIKKHYKKNPVKFAKGILDMIGFNDKETKVLLAIVKRISSGRKVTIIDKKPELNLANITIEHTPGTTLINIIEKSTMKIILRFQAKEGEKKLVIAKVRFDPKTAIDLDDYKDLANKLGLNIGQ